MRFRVLASWLSVVAIPMACSSAELNKAPGGGSSSGDPHDAGGLADAAGRDPTVDLDGGRLPVTSAVTIQIQPSDDGAAILAAIKGATKSVHMTMYLLTDNDVVDALGALRAAGKEVKVILNRNFPGGNGSNAASYAKLQQLGVDVRWAPAGFNYTHAKTFIVDGRSLFVMTMNLTQTSASSNREYIATDTDAEDAAEAEAIFQADFAGNAYLASGKLVVSPRNSVVLDARSRLLALIDGSRKSLDVAGETLSDDAIVTALITAKNAGVAVRIVVDAQTGTSAQQDAIAQLKAAGVPIVALDTPDMHAKAIVADGALAYVGSQNFTANSLNENRELGLITDAAAEVAKVAATIAKDFAAGSPL